VSKPQSCSRHGSARVCGFTQRVSLRAAQRRGQLSQVRYVSRRLKGFRCEPTERKRYSNVLAKRSFWLLDSGAEDSTPKNWLGNCLLKDRGNYGQPGKSNCKFQLTGNFSGAFREIESHRLQSNARPRFFRVGPTVSRVPMLGPEPRLRFR